MSRTPSFQELEKAFWRFVETQCPHPLYSRHRYTWVRANPCFEHRGVSWERSSTPGHMVPGAEPGATHRISFIAADGTLVQDWLRAGPIYSAA
jgi:hypothetical protein